MVELSESALQDLIVAVHAAPRSIWVMDLETNRIVAISRSGLGLLHVEEGEVVPTALTHPDVGEAFERGRVLLRRGDISGFETFVDVRSNGSVMSLRLWLRAVTTHDHRYAAVVPMVLPGTIADTLQAVADISAAVGSVDDSDRIVQVSADVTALLGYEPVSLIGTALVELVDPADADGMQRAFSEAPNTAVDVLVRMRSAAGALQRVMLTLCPRVHERRVFVMLTPVVNPMESSGGRSGAERIADLERHLVRIGQEVEAAGLATLSMQLLDPEQIPGLEDLTSRQWQILTRLLQGARVATIAKEMYLSASTIRNHLATIYRKLGVHSQTELIEKFRAVDDARS